MKLNNQRSIQNTIIFYNGFLSLPDIIHKFKKSGIIDLIHWPYNYISLLKCSSDINFKEILTQLKCNYSDFRMFHETEHFRRVDQSKLNDALTYIKSSVNYVEIDKSPKFLREKLNSGVCLNDHINIFYDFYKLSEHEIDLRNCYESFVNSSVRKLLPHSNVRIFGSTLSRLGKFDSDLDMKIILNERNYQPCQSIQILKSIESKLQTDNPYMVKSFVIPCRFPILHYFDGVLSLNVDISIKPDKSLEVCSLLKLISTKYEFFSYLCVIIKQIYLYEGVLFDRPNIYFTGFKIVALVLHFLQYKKLIPSLENIVNSNQEDQITRPDLGDLLIEFFQYMIKFNPNFAIDLSRGCLVAKSQDVFLQCNFHFDPSLNITSNIGKDQWIKFTESNKNILKTLKVDNHAKIWGLASFIDSNETLWKTSSFNN